MKQILWVVALTTSGTAVTLAQAPPAPPATAGQASTNGRAEPYRSAFEGFRPWTDDAPLDWRRVNDEMKQLGGHAGHLRAAPSAGRPAGATANPAARDMPKKGQEKQK
jgi:hypothetical protein